jgi:alpha-1,2-mannosyltransferase
MYSSISDCDEGKSDYANLANPPVFNFFEPLHYFQHNSGFQTWELSPQFAVRSWAYLLLHWPLAALGPHILGLGKRQQFFALRICLGIISSYCEARFFRVVVDTVNERVGRYVLFCLITAAGMFSATVGECNDTILLDLADPFPQLSFPPRSPCTRP